MKHPKNFVCLIVLMLAVLPAAEINASVFAKYDGIDGESNDSKHRDWIDVESIDWGASRQSGSVTGTARRRGAPVVEDLVMTIGYEKAAPKLLEKCLAGEVLSRLEIEMTAGAGEATYLKYELKNVMVTSFQTSVSENERATAAIGVNFEEIKVTYTQNDARGRPAGQVEMTWNVATASRP